MNAIQNHGERLQKPAASKRKSKKKKSKWVSEESEQLRLVTVLRKLNLCFMHAPLGGGRNIVAAARMKRMGAKKGHPDLVVYNTPPNARNKKGLAIELKRAKPAPSSVSKEQREWLEQLNEQGWECRICYGADEAIEFLNEMGWYFPND